MSEKQINNTTLSPSEIAKKNNWQVGDIVVGTEEKRIPLVCEITAIGTQLVLGLLSKNNVKQKEEIRIPLNDPFITWEKNNG